MKPPIIGIMGAMAEEILGVVHLLSNREDYDFGQRTYYTGQIDGIKTVVVFSRWGKVAAAATVTTLILKFNVTEIIFSGVAGAVNEDLNIGDIVIGKRLIQHDLDARPLTKEFEIPLLKKTFLDIKDKQLDIAKRAVNTLLGQDHLKTVIDPADLQKFNITKPKLVVGDIASGDQFFSKASQKELLLHRIPSVLCVEMEGAAVAQICYEYDIPFTIFRTISDTADEKSHIDFPSFIKNVSNLYSVEIIKTIFEIHKYN